MSKKIAVTGGIGSGKSTVLAMIKQFGYPVFSCDEIYKEIIDDALYISAIKKEFPSAVKDGKIDRAKLAAIVFADQAARLRLNSLAHPLIMRRLFERMTVLNADLMFAEVPLLFEENYQSYFSHVIVVTRGKEERIQAVCTRDGLSETEVVARLCSQYDYDDNKNMLQWKEQGFYVLENCKDLMQLKEKLKNLIEKLK